MKKSKGSDMLVLAALIGITFLCFDTVAVVSGSDTSRLWAQMAVFSLFLIFLPYLKLLSLPIKESSFWKSYGLYCFLGLALYVTDVVLVRVFGNVQQNASSWHQTLLLAWLTYLLMPMAWKVLIYSKLREEKNKRNSNKQQPLFWD